MKKRKKGKKIFIFIGTLTVMLLLLCYKSFDNRKEAPAEHIIIFLEKSKETEIPYRVDKAMLLNDDICYLDYCPEKETVLYVDAHDRLIEKNIITKDAQEIKILEICKAAFPQKKFQDDLKPARIKYESDGQEILFALEDSIYNYNIMEKELIKKVENIPFYDKGQYKWMKSGKLYYTIYEHPCHKLYMYNKNKLIPVPIDKDIWNFDVSEDEEKIYFVASYVKKINAFGFELGLELGECSLRDKEIRIYQTFNFGNYFLKCADDKYLFYINGEKNFWGTKINKVYCVETESGKSWCIYKTYRSVSDIIIEN